MKLNEAFLQNVLRTNKPKNPDLVTRHNLDQEYLEYYDAERQLELESYGYSFLRINKFSLIPDRKDRSVVDVLNDLLEKSFP